MLYHVMRVEIHEITNPDDAALVRQCACYLHLDGKLNAFKIALSELSDKKAFSKLYDETERSFFAADWMRKLWEIVQKKLRAKYPKHRFTKEAVDTATGILLVHGMQAMFMPVSCYYPCLVCHPWAAAEVIMFCCPNFNYHTISDEARERYTRLVQENMDFWEIHEIIAEDISRFVFQYYPDVTSIKDVAMLSPELRRRIETDAFDILMKILLIKARTDRQ